MQILKDVLSVLTDYKHMSGFKFQGLILQQLLVLVETNTIQDKIFIDRNTKHQFSSNKECIVQLLIEWINQLFPNLNKVQIEAFVLNLFNTVFSWSDFKATLRDLLISMKSFSSTNDELYQEERDVRTIHHNIFVDRKEAG